MALSSEEAEKIKADLLNQLNNFPEEKREQIKEQVNSLNPEQFEKLVEDNDLNNLDAKCVFCAIVAGKSPSIKIAENQTDIAILEINPLSRGHTLIVPKSHADSIPDSTKQLAEQVGKVLKTKLSPKEIKVNELNIMNHHLLEVIPIYGGEVERKPATETELKEVFEKITKQEEPKPEKKEEQNPAEEIVEEVENLPKLPPRIPN